MVRNGEEVGRTFHNLGLICLNSLVLINNKVSVKTQKLKTISSGIKV